MQDTRSEEEGWRDFQNQKNFKEGGIQKWAGGLLDDSRPLEVLYAKHPETDEPVVVVKIDDLITVCKGTITTKNAIAVVGTMAGEAWEKHESTGVPRESDDGVTGD